MSSLSLKYSKVLIAFLPGHKFTTCVGWVIGVYFTSNRSTSTKRRVFKMLHMVYAILLNLGILIMLADCMFNLLPSRIRNIRYNISGIVGQGFVVFNTVLVLVYRVYLIMIAAPLSMFEKKLVDSGTFLASNPSSFKLWANSLVSVYFLSTALQGIYFVGVIAKFFESSPWMYTKYLATFVIWPVGIVRFVAFAIVITALDRLLDLLESFVKRVQSIVGEASANRFCKSRMTRESRGQLPVEANILEIEHLLSELQKIQELFDSYDQLLGTLIFLLLSNSTIGFVVTLTEVVQSRSKELENRSSFIKWLNILNHLLPFTLLNIGYLAKSRIKNLKIILKRDIAAAMLRSRNEGLMNLYRNIEEWNWKMSAAGFFTVDRTLMTGIASASLTYIVLLFQIEGVLKAGPVDDDRFQQQFLRLLMRLNRTQFASELEY